MIIYCIFNLLTHPIVIVQAALQRIWSKQKHKDRRGVDSIHNTFIEDSIFQLIEIQKDLITSRFKLGFQDSCFIGTTYSAVTYEYIVFFVSHIRLRVATFIFNIDKYTIIYLDFKIIAEVFSPR